MTARKTFLIASSAALVGLPTWAAASSASSSHSQGAAAPGQTKDADEHGTSHGAAGTHGKPGGSHKCKPHGIAFVLTGELGSQALTKNSDGTYSGEVTLKEVTHTNHHAKGTKAPYTEKLTNVHVTFGLADTNNDGSVGLDDLKEGDGVKLIGKITRIAKKCHNTFEAKITIRKVVFSAPDGD